MKITLSRHYKNHENWMDFSPDAPWQNSATLDDVRMFAVLGKAVKNTLQTVSPSHLHAKVTLDTL